MVFVRICDLSLHSDRGRAAVCPQSSFLDGQSVAVDVSELSCEKAKQAEEQHDQDPLAHSSSRGIAYIVENGHWEGGGSVKEQNIV